MGKRIRCIMAGATWVVITPYLLTVMVSGSLAEGYKAFVCEWKVYCSEYKDFWVRLSQAWAAPQEGKGE